MYNDEQPYCDTCKKYQIFCKCMYKCKDCKHWGGEGAQVTAKCNNDNSGNYRIDTYYSWDCTKWSKK